jgi:hypothetical protein
MVIKARVILWDRSCGSFCGIDKGHSLLWDSSGFFVGQVRVF